MMTSLYPSNVLLLILLSRIAEADPFGHFVKQRSVPSFAVNSTVANSTAANSTVANSTIAVTTNNSTSQASRFSFIIPYNQTQACDIYGALCQTGSITVGVNLTSKTSTTVLPCSSYLTAQSSFLVSESGPSSADAVVAFPDQNWPNDWWTGFGRSPECRTYAQGQYPTSKCGSGNHPWQLPPTVWRYWSPGQTHSCCGNCSLDIPEVKLYYFPDVATTECHHNQTSNSTSVLATGNLGKRRQSLVGDGSIAVVSGHTFTSPSLYLQVVGAVTVTDQCPGTVGPVITDPIITLAPGQLSTWRPPPPGQFQYDNFTIGEVWYDWSSEFAVGDPGKLFPLDVKDLACPTWGLGINTLTTGSARTTIGPPFLPLIGPMMQAFSLDPVWSGLCTGILEGPFADYSIEIYDPPIALTPGVALVPAQIQNPATTPHPSDAGPTTTPDPQVVRPTAVASPASSPVLAPALPTNPKGPKETSVGDPPSPSLPEPSISHDPPSDGTLLPQASSVADPDVQLPNPAPASSMTRMTDPNVPLSVDPNTMLGDPQSPGVGTTASAEPAEQIGDGSIQQSQGIGAIIYNALGRSDGRTTHSINKINTLTIPSSGDQDVDIPGGSQVVSIQPSNIVLDGTTYSAGGPVMTLSDSIFTIVPQPEPLESASVANNDPKNNITPDPDSLTIAGQPVVINPSTPTLNNAIISPTDPVQTLAGTINNQQQSAASVTENAGASLSLVTSDPDPTAGNPVSAADETPTPAISALSIAGTTISAGGPAITVSGTVISLQSSGALIMGSSTVDLSMARSGTALLPDPDVPASATYDIDSLGVQIQPHSPFAVVNGATLSAGGPGFTISESLISLEPGGKTLDVGTERFAMPTEAADATYDVGGFSVQVQPQSSVAVIDGITLSAGGPGITVSGSLVSLEQGGKTLDVGTARFAMPTEAADAASPYAIDGFNIHAQPQSSFAVVDGVTLTAGSPGISISGTLLSLESGGKTLDVGTARFAMPTEAADAASPYAIDGYTIQPEPQSSYAVIDGVTLTAGSPGISISGTLISLEPGGKTLDIGTEHFAMPTEAASASSPYNIDGYTIQPQPQQSSFAVVDGVTLTAGAPGISISGTLLSLESDGKTLDIGTARFPLPTVAADANSPYEINGYTIQPEPQQSSFAVVDGVTLSAGGNGVSISGSLVSLESGGKTLDIGTGRFAMPTAALGGNGNGTASGVQAFTGGQGRRFEVPSGLMVGTLGLGCLMVLT